MARNRNNALVAFNDEPMFDGYDYYRSEQVESEDFTDYGVELLTWADEKLIGKHIDYDDGTFEII